jgi:hypothetical protein
MPDAVSANAWLSRFRRITQLGFPASYPLVQFPNAPLLVALGASLVGRLLDPDAARYTAAVAFLGLAVWAWLEAVTGINLFRRVLGAGFLVYLAVELGGRLTT